MGKEKTLNLDIVSKYRNEIYGIAAIWVIIHHAFDFHVFELKSFGTIGTIINTIGSWGNMSVDIFLFLSGISLYFAWTKNNNYAQFMVSRLIRIIPSFLIIVGPCILYTSFIMPHGNPNDFPVMMSTMSFWFNGGRFFPWYISGILFCYLMYPTIHTVIYDINISKRYVRFLMLLLFSYFVVYGFYKLNPDYYWMIELVICRMPVFIIGCFFGKLVKEHKQISSKWWILIVIIAISFVLIRLKTESMWYFRLPFMIGAITLSFIFARIFQWLNSSKIKALNLIASACKKVGGVSFEIYIAHVMFFKVVTMDHWFQYSKWLWLAGMILSFVVAFAVKNLTDKFSSKYHDKLVIKN